MAVILVTIPAIVGALGSILSAYIALKVRAVATSTNGRMVYLENELKLVRQLLAHEVLANSEKRTLPYEH